jgi:F420-non-reducing hydrogenase iron-sulfur subunit
MKGKLSTEEKTNKEFLPKIIGFFCNWCTSAGADLAGISRLQYPASILPIRVMCSSSVDPIYVLKSFLGGADAVLIGGCHPGDCHYQDGNYHARRRFVLLNKVFEEFGLDAKRIRLSWISASEGKKFADVIKEYTDEIQKSGPNSVKKEIFL